MKFRLKIYSAIFIVLLSIGISGFMLFENMSLINAIYFSIVTMATVGYGDIHPKTEIGKILTIIIIIGGGRDVSKYSCQYYRRICQPS
jgi:voltage-gated potassium channel Kch